MLAEESESSIITDSSSAPIFGDSFLAPDADGPAWVVVVVGSPAAAEVLALLEGLATVDGPPAAAPLLLRVHRNTWRLGQHCST